MGGNNARDIDVCSCCGSFLGRNSFRGKIRNNDPVRLLQKRQGKARLAKYYVPLEESGKHKIEYEVHRLVVNRDPKFTNFVEAIIERMGELERQE